MPYSSVADVPDYVAEGKRKQWLEVFNSAFASARAKGLSAKECEASAFRQANGVVKSAILEIVKDAIDIFLKRDISTASRNDLPDSAFAYIEPGGTKDESGKTTPRSKRHFPIHDAAHVRNALARASQSPFGAKAMGKIRAAAKKFGIQVSKEETGEMKSETFTREVVIKSIDKQEQIVYGIVMEPTAEGELKDGEFIGKIDAVDTQGDFTTASEIYKANVRFMEQLALLKANPHNVGHDNKNQPQTAIIENFIAPEDFTLGEETVRKGSWVQGTKIYDPELWAEVLRGEISGYSIEGFGVKTEIEEAKSE